MGDTHIQISGINMLWNSFNIRTLYTLQRNLIWNSQKYIHESRNCRKIDRDRNRNLKFSETWRTTQKNRVLTEDNETNRLNMDFCDEHGQLQKGAEF